MSKTKALARLSKLVKSSSNGALKSPPKERPRTCDVCNKKYHRRNLIEAWPGRKPGHRIGRLKVRQRVCLECMTAMDSGRMLRAVGARWVEKKEKAE